MPYDVNVAFRVRQWVASIPGFTERRMFGGIAFLLHGNMCIGVWHANLIARVGPDRYSELLQQAHVREFDVTGRPMRGWIMVEPDGIEEEANLQRWCELAVTFVASLPRK